MQATPELAKTLETILDGIHPRMVDCFYWAAVPYWFNRPIINHIRAGQESEVKQIDIARSIVERLNNYPFIRPMDDRVQTRTDYVVHSAERDFLNRRAIASQPAQYIAIHQQAYNYWLANPDPNPFIQNRNLLYHHFFVDEQASVGELINLFRGYRNDRLLGPIGELVAASQQAQTYLQLLNKSDGILDDLLNYMRARQAQLEGNFSYSKTLISSFEAAPNSPLQPYIKRLEGTLQLEDEQYAKAIDSFHGSISAFDDPEIPQIDEKNGALDKAETQIDLGRAHTSMAHSVRGVEAKIRPSLTVGEKIGDVFNFFLSLPLVMYLRGALGSRVWQPDFWHVLPHLDWIVTSLFSTGAKLYTEADTELEKSDNAALSIVADEKLGFLYLDMGDTQRAHDLFEHLLTEKDAPLSQYRRASVQVGLAQAALRLGNPEQAVVSLEQAIPVVKAFEDAALEANATALLGEAYADSAAHAAAANSAEKDQLAANSVEQLTHALKLFQKLGKQRNTTNVAEQLAALGRNPLLTENNRLSAQQSNEIASEHRYAVAFRHRATVFFKEFALVMFFALLFVGALFLFRVQAVSPVVPNITFQAEAILEPDKSFDPELSQSATSLQTITLDQPKTFLWRGILGGLTAFGVYLLLSTYFGLRAITQATPEKIGQMRDDSSLYLTTETLRVGGGDSQKMLNFADVTGLIVAERTLSQRRLPDDSYTIIVTESDHIAVSANTANYDGLRERILASVPNKVPRTIYTYSLLNSKMGRLLIGTLVLFVLLIIMSFATPNLLTTPLIGPYSLTGLHPYLYLGLLIPMLWWFAVQPARIQCYLQNLHVYLLGVGGLGVLFLFLLVSFQFRPILRFPNIYLALIALVCFSCCIYVWVTSMRRARHPRPVWLQPAVTALAVFVLLVLSINLGQYILREVTVYHYVVQGNSAREIVTDSNSEIEKAVGLRDSANSYNTAIEWAEWKVFNAQIRRSIVAEFYANRGVMKLGQATFQDDVNQLLITEQDEQGQSYTDEQGVSAETPPALYSETLEDFDVAIANANAKNRAQYRLWRAYIYHVNGNSVAAMQDYDNALDVLFINRLPRAELIKAHSGRGWLNISEGQIDDALLAFENAGNQYNDFSQSWQKVEEVKKAAANAYLGLGYVNYEQEKFQLALDAWAESVRLDATNALATVNLGTSYWRLATSANGREGENSCLPAFSAELRQAAQVNYEAALNIFNDSLALGEQSTSDLALTHQTRAQIYFLYNVCPDLIINGEPATRSEVLQAGADSYAEAARLLPENADYPHKRGRFLYAAWDVLPDKGPTFRQLLLDALAAADLSVKLDSNVEKHHTWRNFIFNEATSGTLRYGDDVYANGNPDLALELYEFVANSFANNSASAFKAGLIALELEQTASADSWLQAGLSRATINEDEDAIVAAFYQLRSLSDQYAIAPLIEQFVETGIDFSKPRSSKQALDLAEKAFELGDTETAKSLFAAGFDNTVRLGDLTYLRDSLLRIRPLIVDSTIQQIFADWRDGLPRLKQRVWRNDNNNQPAFDLGLIALALGDVPLSAESYLEGVRRTTASNIDYWPLDASQNYLYELWLSAETDETPEVAKLLAVPDAVALSDTMDRWLSAEQQSDESVYENGLYWRYTAWFRFGVGQAAFRTGNDLIAEQVLLSAHPYAELANKLGSPGKTPPIDLYLNESAWGWYYVARGNDLVKAGVYDAALNDYEIGEEVINPIETASAHVDNTIAAFGIALMALATDDLDKADKWYAEGISRAEQYERLEKKDERLDLIGDAASALQAFEVPSGYLTIEEAKERWLSILAE